MHTLENIIVNLTNMITYELAMQHDSGKANYFENIWKFEFEKFLISQKILIFLFY